MATVKKPVKKMQMGGDTTMMKMGGTMAKNGKKFPDLNKDGKITKADILKGRGVIAKKGTKVKKAQDGAKSPSAYAISKFEARKAQTPVRKGASSAPIFGVNKAVKNAVLDDETGTMLKGFRMDKTKAVPMKSGGKMKKAMMGTMAKPMMKSGGKATKTCKYGCK